MYQVERDTLISDIMLNAPETSSMFASIGMHCMGCALASGESVEEACAAHGVDVDEFLDKLNNFLAKD
jgi:hybrid cluster-associated redox disulfide protein